MKKLLSAMSALVLLVPAMPAQAGYSQSGGVRERNCYKEVYREQYIPGTSTSPGRVRRWTETKKVPCGNRGRRPNQRNGGPYRDPRNRPSSARQDFDDNSCVEGSIIGGIGGGALGGVLSTKENWIWAIPTGVIGGALVGCQVDGG